MLLAVLYTPHIYSFHLTHVTRPTESHSSHPPYPYQAITLPRANQQPATACNGLCIPRQKKEKTLWWEESVYYMQDVLLEEEGDELLSYQFTSVCY